MRQPLAEGTRRSGGLRRHPEHPEYQMYRDVQRTRLPWSAWWVDEAGLPAALLDHLHRLLARRDWVPLGTADEQKPAADGRSKRGACSSIRSGAGTGRRRDFAVASACISRRSSRRWASPNSNTTPATTGSAPLAGMSTLRLVPGDVHHPAHTVPVGTHPEAVAPRRLLERHRDRAAAESCPSSRAARPRRHR